MFLPVSVYMKKSKIERQKHIKLIDPCVEIGGGSKDFRALLAHYLKTFIPKNREALLCHACNTAGCSNVRHLYWGTTKENVADLYTTGYRMKSGFRINEEHKRKIGLGASKANKGIPKSEDHKLKLAVRQSERLKNPLLLNKQRAYLQKARVVLQQRFCMPS